MKKVTSVENANYSEKKLKTIALSALLVGVIALNGYGIAKWLKPTPKEEFKSDYAYGFDINEADWCEPNKTIRYVAPAGFILEGNKCYRIDEHGQKKYVEPAIVEELSAPEGYVLIGDKCFKINETEKEKGR